MLTARKHVEVIVARRKAIDLHIDPLGEAPRANDELERIAGRRELGDDPQVGFARAGHAEREEDAAREHRAYFIRERGHHEIV